MKKAPWVKWYPDQFLGGIVGLTVEEIGVYSVLLNMIYDRGGHVEANMERLAARCRMRPTSFAGVLASLVEQGKLVFENNLISNQRAAIEIKTRTKVLEKWRENLTPGELKLRDNTSKINGDTSPSGTASAAPRASETQTQSKKERKKDSTSPKKATVNGIDYTEEFETKVWQPYPRKKGTSKHKAFQLWNMLNEMNQQRVIATIPIHASQMKNEGRPEEKIKHLQFFISERIYETYAVPSTESNVVPLEWHKTATRDQWMRALKIYEMDSNWRAAWGPKPGQAGCAVPPDLIEALPYHLHPDRNRPRSQVGVAENKDPEAV